MGTTLIRKINVNHSINIVWNVCWPLGYKTYFTELRMLKKEPLQISICHNKDPIFKKQETSNLTRYLLYATAIASPIICTCLFISCANMRYAGLSDINWSIMKCTAFLDLCLLKYIGADYRNILDY